MSSQVLAGFVRENSEDIEQLQDGIEQLFEGKKTLGRKLFLERLKGIQILERFLRSEVGVAQLDLRVLSLTLNRVLCEWVVAIV